MISIIVTSFDIRREPQISALLKSIASQSSRDFRVVYITEGTQNLSNIVEKLLTEMKIPGGVFHYNAKLGLAGARNAGVVKATGDLVAFVDDDVYLDNGWCEAVASSFGCLPDIAGATGPSLPVWDGQAMDWMPVELDWLIGCTRWFRSMTPVETTNVWGTNMCFSRAVLQQAGPFLEGSGMSSGTPTGGIGEDIDMSVRVREKTGGKLYYVPGMKVFSEIQSYRLSSRYIIKRSIRVGFDRKIVRKNMRKSDLNIAVEPGLLQSLAAGFLLLATPRRSRSVSELLRSTLTTAMAVTGLALGYFLGPLED